jgi:hypothetical protein
MAEPINPPENRGLPPKGKFPSGKWITLPVQLSAPHCKMYIFQPLCPRLSSLHASFFTLHPTLPPQTAQSFTTPLHYFLHLLFQCTSHFGAIALNHHFFRLFALNSLDYSPALMSSISLRIAELVQHRDSRASEIRRIYGTIEAAKGSKRYQQYIDIQAESYLKRVAKLVQHRAIYIHKLLGRYHLVQKAKESKSYMQYKKIQVEIRYLKYRAQSFPKSTATVIDDIPSVSFSRLCWPFVSHSRSHVSSHNGRSPSTFRSTSNPTPWPRWSSPNFAKRTTSSI